MAGGDFIDPARVGRIIPALPTDRSGCRRGGRTPGRSSTTRAAGGPGRTAYLLHRIGWTPGSGPPRSPAARHDRPAGPVLHGRLPDHAGARPLRISPERLPASWTCITTHPTTAWAGDLLRRPGSRSRSDPAPIGCTRQDPVRPAGAYQGAAHSGSLHPGRATLETRTTGDAMTGSISPFPLIRSGKREHPVRTLQYLLRAQATRSPSTDLRAEDRCRGTRLQMTCT